jgi:hypothetical protein
MVGGKAGQAKPAPGRWGVASAAGAERPVVVRNAVRPRRLGMSQEDKLPR